MLVSSMHDEKHFAGRALRAGALGYINKRESIRKVIDAVRQVVMDFMVDLRESEAHTEEAVFFNDWTSRGTLVRRS